MIRKDVTIINKLGLHARAAAKLVNCASEYASNVQLVRNDQKINGKSIMGVMMLAASKGTALALEVQGEDEIEAVAALTKLIEERFGEPE
jgi:phosphocarrier protein